jgi:hypothetical protein
MFKLQPNPTFFATVDIPVPGGEPMPLEVEFRHMRREQAIEFARGLGQREPLESMREVVCGWRGADVEFSADALADLHSNYAGAADRILTAYLDELRGARRKN